MARGFAGAAVSGFVGAVFAVSAFVRVRFAVSACAKSSSMQQQSNKISTTMGLTAWLARGAAFGFMR